MSGVEIATIALKTFPILLKLANEWVPIFQGAKDWWSFKTSYMEFVSTIRTESISYKQNLQMLLSPLEFDLEENGSLHKNPDSRKWHDPTIRVQLKKRIQEEDFDWFIEQLQNMNATLDSLYKMLPQRDGKLRALDHGTIEYEMNRLRVSFSKDKQPLLDRVSKLNGLLSNFLHNESLIRHPTNSKQIRSSRKLQSYAKALYKTLQEGFKCSSHVHPCAITADWKDLTLNNEDPSLNLLLGGPNAWKQLQWEVHEEATRVSFEQNEKHMLTQVHQLDKQLQFQKRKETLVEAFESHRIGIAAIAATSTILNPASPAKSTDNLWVKRQTAKLKKKLVKKAPAKLSAESASQVSANLGTLPPTTNQPSPISSSTSIESAPKPRRQVRFEGAESDTSPTGLEQKGSTKILDVCSFLSSTANLTRTEYFDLGKGRFTFQLDSPAPPRIQELSLDDLTSISQAIPSLRDRLRLGLDLALMIISLGSSGWIPADWDRGQVSVIKRQYTSKETNRPYFSHHCLSTTLAREAFDNQEQERNTEAALFSLGVILLELTDKCNLEQTEYWKNNCHEGTPNGFTRYCAAVEWHQAIELCQSVDLTDPIKRCVKNKFGKAANLEDRDFLQEVFEGVVAPLENYIVGSRQAAR